MLLGDQRRDWGQRLRNMKAAWCGGPKPFPAGSSQVEGAGGGGNLTFIALASWGALEGFEPRLAEGPRLRGCQDTAWCLPGGRWWGPVGRHTFVRMPRPPGRPLPAVAPSLLPSTAWFLEQRGRRRGGPPPTIRGTRRQMIEL